MGSAFREPPDSPRVPLAAALAGVPLSQCEGADAEPCEVIDHSALFAADESPRCHVCDERVQLGDDEGFAVPGRGLLVFNRGEERRAEEPRLCPTCGAAIGMTMLTRWAIEEEEG